MALIDLVTIRVGGETVTHHNLGHRYTGGLTGCGLFYERRGRPARRPVEFTGPREDIDCMSCIAMMGSAP